MSLASSSSAVGSPFPKSPWSHLPHGDRLAHRLMNVVSSDPRSIVELGSQKGKIALHQAIGEPYAKTVKPPGRTKPFTISASMIDWTPKQILSLWEAAFQRAKKLVWEVELARDLVLKEAGEDFFAQAKPVIMAPGATFTGLVDFAPQTAAAFGGERAKRVPLFPPVDRDLVTALKNFGVRVDLADHICQGRANTPEGRHQILSFVSGAFVSFLHHPERVGEVLSDWGQTNFTNIFGLLFREFPQLSHQGIIEGA